MSIPAKKQYKRHYRLLNRVLTNREMSRETLAALIGREKNYVNTRFSGKASFSVDEAYRILELLNVDAEYFTLVFPQRTDADYDRRIERDVLYGSHA